MSDTPQTPGRPRFEPPPWEREQFEELARRRAESARAEAEAEAARARAAAEAEAVASASATGGEPAATPTGAPEAPEAGKSGEARELDEKRVEAMLAELAGEQATSLRPVRRASKVLSGVMGAVGLSITTMAAVMGLRSQGGDTLAIASAVIGASLGLLTISLAVWLWSRTR